MADNLRLWRLVFDRQLESAPEGHLLPHTFHSRVVMTDVFPKENTLCSAGYIVQRLNWPVPDDAPDAALRAVTTRLQVHIWPNWGLPYKIKFRNWQWVKSLRLRVWEYSDDESLCQSDDKRKFE